MVGGMFGSYNVALAWISSTFARPRAKRAAAYAIINSLGNSKSNEMPRLDCPSLLQLTNTPRLSYIAVAQVWSPYLYDKKYSPRYRVAFATNTVMAAAAVLFCLVLRFCLARENKKMEEREIADREGAETKRIRYVL